MEAAMKNFQAGGLAEVTMPVDEEEDIAEVIAMGGPEAVTGTEEILEGVTPDPIAELRKMATMNKDQALARLRESRENLATRRTKQEQRIEQDRWLALAQSMLAPTRTGAFGENVGMAAGALRDVNQQAFEQQEILQAQEEQLLDSEYRIAGDYFDALANLEGFKNTSRARVVGTRPVIDPRQAQAVLDGTLSEAEANRVIASIVMLPSGETVNRIETADGIPFEEGGQPLLLVDPKLSPTQAAAQAAATNTATQSVRTQFDVAKMGMDAMPRLSRLQRAYGLLSTLREDTSGLNEKIRGVAKFLGITEMITDSTDLAQLHGMFGQQVLMDLRALTGTKTDFEYKQVEQMNANLRQDVASNLQILEEQMGVLNTIVDKGEFAAQNLSEGPGTEEKDFMLENFLRFRKAQAEAAAEYDAQTRIAPADKEAQLIELIQQNQGNPEEQTRRINQFREYYDIRPEIALELRKAGAGI
jgi:hypothetical protein